MVELGVVIDFSDSVLRARVSALEQKVCDYVFAGSGMDSSVADELYKLEPETPLALVGLAMREYDAKKYVRAVDCVNDAIHIDPLCKAAVLLKLRYISEFAEQGYFDFISTEAFVTRAFKNFQDDVDVLERLIIVAAETLSNPELAKAFFEHGKELDRERFSSWDDYMKTVVEKPLLYVVEKLQ